MAIKVLIVDKVIEPAMNIISKLGETEVDVAMVSKVDKAINNLKTHAYHLVIFGDQLNGGGDTYDVALAIKGHEKNRKIPMLCVGTQISRRTKLQGVLAPRGQGVDVFDEQAVDACVKQIREKFANYIKGK